MLHAFGRAQDLHLGLSAVSQATSSLHQSTCLSEKHLVFDPINPEGLWDLEDFYSFFFVFIFLFLLQRNQLLRSLWCLWWQLGGHHLHDSDTIGHCGTPGAGQRMVRSSNKANVYHSNQQNTLKTGNDFWASFWCAHLSSTWCGDS